MRISSIAFTQRGLELAESIGRELMAGGDVFSCARGFGADKVDHDEWARSAFGGSDALLFVGATGIAVRTVAPLLVSKASDPAVISIDDRATFCIPLVSGHIGGANDLARRIAGLVGATPVVTTATDVSGVFAVDSWAVSQGLAVRDVQRIKLVSSKLLRGETARCASELPIAGEAPAGVEAVGPDFPDVDFSVGVHPREGALNLVPRAVVAGIGCRKGTAASAIEQAFREFLDSRGIAEEAVVRVASIDLKKHEPGLVAFCAAHGLEFVTFSPEELNAQEGDFAASGFVSGVTGTDNVCERAAAAAAGPAGSVIEHKTVVGGITFAAALLPVDLKWPK